MNSNPTQLRWDVYLIEALLLGTFMVSACVFTVLLEHPDSPVRQAVQSGGIRRAMMGLAMGSTAIALIYSPVGKRSGAQINPAVTLSFLRLGRMTGHDAFFYILAQFAGGFGGVVIASLVLGRAVAHPRVNYAATAPGLGGTAVAFAAELLMAFLMMTVVLFSNRFRRLLRFTGVFAGLLVAAYITLEAPLSGMSLNPARTFGSNLVARLWTGLWIYFTAPVLGMLAAVEVNRLFRGDSREICGKYTHARHMPCVARCDCLAPSATETRTMEAKKLCQTITT